MKQVYQCETCKEVFESKYDCHECEASHISSEGVFVVEVFFSHQTRYESSGDYTQIQEFHKIEDEKIIEEIQELIKNKNAKLLLEKLVFSGDDCFGIIENYRICEYIDVYGDRFEFNILDFLEDEFENEYIDIHFTDTTHKGEQPDFGYLSFFKASKEEYAKLKNKTNEIEKFKR